MKKSKFTEEQIAYALRQVESGTAARRRLPAARRQRGHLLHLEEEIRPPGRQRAAAAAIARGREQPAEAAGRRPHARQAHADGGAAKKSLRPTQPPRAGRAGFRRPSASVRAGLSSGAVQSRGVVPPSQAQRPDGAAAAHSGARARAAAIRLSAHLGAAAARGLAGESEAGAAAVSPRRPAAAACGCAGASTSRAASRAGAGAGGPHRALEHGLRPRCAGRRPAVSRADRGRSVESPESDLRSGCEGPGQ